MSVVLQPDVELRLPARAGNVAVVRRVLRDLGERLELDPAVLDDLVLAASEACSNVVMHAYPMEEGGQLHVKAIVHDDHITLLARDGGRGRGTAGPGLGVGLSLIAAITRSLEIATDGEGWREVRMTFPLARTRRGDEDDDGDGFRRRFAAA
jgi:anti-sigma regulatory factor (Ser/Thr protein kinase)